MPSKDTYGATPPSNASATGAADATATLLDGRSPSTAGESSSRFWRDIGICIGTLGAGDAAKENKSASGCTNTVIIICYSTDNHIVFSVAIKISG